MILGAETSGVGAAASAAASTDSASALQGLLAKVQVAVADGDLKAACRLADAARRRAPKSQEIWRLYGKLLARDGDLAAAQTALVKAVEFAFDPGLEADLIQVLVDQQKLDVALDRLQQAVQRCAVDRGDALAVAADRLILSSAKPISFAAMDRHGKVWGQAGPWLEPPRVEILLGEAAVQSLEAWREAGRVWTFEWNLFEGSIPCGLSVVVAGALHPLEVPHNLGLDGRAQFDGDLVTGWVRSSWSPLLAISLKACDQGGNECDVALGADSEQPGRWTFSLQPQREGLGAGPIALLAVLPGDRRVALPDSPVLTRLPPALRPLRAKARGRVGSEKRVDIIIPVYRGLEETLACIRSAQQTATGRADLIVIDDASPEPALSEALDALATTGAITLLRNPANLGFPATVNLGLTLHPGRDVVILNADAQVYPGWLDRLQAAAASAPDVGTVTPLTNSGSIASYPAEGIAADPAFEPGAIARITARVNDQHRVDIPTGVGFCLYIRRDCLAATGLLDTACFEKGYGEENDFCLRAAALGWRHLLAADVFVQHIGGRSFGDSRAALQERNGRILTWRHPGYDQQVQRFVVADPLQPARRRIDQARLAALADPVVLLVSLSLEGGVERVVRERCERLRADGRRPVVLRSAASGGGVRLETDDGFGDLNYAGLDDHAQLLAFIGDLGIEAVEVHHFLHIPAPFLDQLLSLGLPYDVFLHDYAWICPRLSLLGGDGVYCGEPAIAACEVCIDAHGSSLGEDIGVAALRMRSDRWLGGARRVVAPSHDLERRLARHFPNLTIEVEPWELDVDPLPATPQRGDQTAKVAVLGAIGAQKGYNVLLDCARDARARDLPLEFVVIGFTQDDVPLVETGKVFVTGRYTDDEIPALLAREAPDLAFLPSVTPETWCFSLSHLLRAGIPTAAFDLGAIAERLAVVPGSHLFALSTSARELNDRLLQAIHVNNNDSPNLEGPRGLLTLENSSCSLSTSSPPAFSAVSYDMTLDPAPLGQDLSTSVEVLPLEQGLYLVSVTAADSAPSDATGALDLPAVHVGSGPGVDQEHLELMDGISTKGSWLHHPGDALVIKVKAPRAMVLLTSLRAAGAAGLSLAVERLDGHRAPQQQESDGLRTEVTVHISRRGDATFREAAWATAPGQDLPIEGFAITPLEGVSPDKIEYKGLTAAGVETPWTTSGKLCGSQGEAMPLTGFAVRLAPELRELFDCEYSGAFRSGRTLGPFANGAPCQATSPDDYLEGIRFFLKPRESELVAKPPAIGPRVIGPKFSVFREEIQ